LTALAFLDNLGSGAAGIAESERTECTEIATPVLDQAIRWK
jgi:hypothetical protein